MIKNLFLHILSFRMFPVVCTDEFNENANIILESRLKNKSIVNTCITIEKYFYRETKSV